jgi:cytochrome c oxidase subunit II
MADASVLHPAGPAASALADLTVVLTFVCTLVFVGTMATLAWALWRRKRDDGLDVRRWLIVGAGIVLPSVVLAALLAYSSLRSFELYPPHETGAATVQVTGHMWWWDVRYGDAGGQPALRTANELVVPVGRPVTLALGSADVIHSFWVPALSGKVDMMPGRVHSLRIVADQAGVYRGPCAEYCGDQHARMTLHVVALPPDEYDRWRAAQAAPAVEPTDAAARRGRALFEARHCNACHAVRGLVEGTGYGPDLTHVGSRRHLGAGLLPLNRDTLARWIADTQHLKPGARMPASPDLDAASLADLAAFLEGLK